MTKADLRKIYLHKRTALTASERMKMDDLILIQFQQLGIYIPSLIMTYAPLEKMNEFDPQLITDYCYFKNPQQVLFYPVIHSTEPTMHCEMVDDNTTFQLNKYGIPEPVNGTPMFPEEIDLIIVPLLAYSAKGQRVGYGKGYYDRFLKQCRKDVVKIGFSYFEAEAAIEGTDRHDVKLDYCVSPTNSYRF
ncbi:MAG: 5-formyltetrahydrofolate cyclo-ligase [Chitinophagaceae bacterium]|nr:MAG: 5-formyltetrahydrofolate cyclo-ligase [Chitinophagaceae bacterium]